MNFVPVGSQVFGPTRLVGLNVPNCELFGRKCRSRARDVPWTVSIGFRGDRLLPTRQ